MTLHYQGDFDEYIKVFELECKAAAEMMLVLQHQLYQHNLKWTLDPKTLFEMVQEMRYPTDERYKKVKGLDKSEYRTLTFDDLLGLTEQSPVVAAVRTAVQEEFAKANKEKSDD